MCRYVADLQNLAYISAVSKFGTWLFNPGWRSKHGSGSVFCRMGRAVGCLSVRAGLLAMASARHVCSVGLPASRASPLPQRASRCAKKRPEPVGASRSRHCLCSLRAGQWPGFHYQWNCSSSVEPVSAVTEDEPPWITVVMSSK